MNQGFKDVSIILNREFYQMIELECEAFKNRTWDANDVTTEDVLFSFFHQYGDQEKGIQVLNDWDEGKGNDPFWDDERNMNSCYAFIHDMVDRLNSLAKSIQ